MKNELPVRKCRLCGDEFRAARHDQVFCSKEHRQKFHRRAELRGAKAVELLIAWRVTRGGKKGILGEIAAVVDGWVKEDRAAGALQYENGERK